MTTASSTQRPASPPTASADGRDGPRVGFAPPTGGADHANRCPHCLDLAADARRREPHPCLALRHNVPLVSQSAAGVPFSMMTFACRECGTVWRLYDRANELFVSWVPDWRLVGARR